jgi:carbamoylphosphate synthase small subunit
MAMSEKLQVTQGTSAVVQGLGNYYVKDNIEQKSDLTGDQIVAETSITARAKYIKDNWGIERTIIKEAIEQFDTRRVSFMRKSRGEMETVLSAENRKEQQQTQMDRWLGGLRR